MSWTAPRTWTAGEIVTASIMNSAVRDNLRYIKGLDGVPTIESGLTIDNTGGDERLLLPLLSTAECTTVLNAEGEMAFDEQTHRVKIYDNDGVESLVSTADVDDTPVDAAATDPISSNWAYDHVAAADPHTGYVLESLADAAGDIFYASADNTWAKLAKGTEGQILRIGAAIPAWASATATQEIFVPFLFGTGATEGAALGYYGWKMDAAGEVVITSFKVPHDFSSITNSEIIFIGVDLDDETFDWTATTYFAAVGESYDTHSDSTTADGAALSNGQHQSLDISAAFTGLAADDYAGLTFTVDAVSDGANGYIYALGLRLRYS